jgi:ABC-type multidrug transport system ATPase subunit
VLIFVLGWGNSFLFRGVNGAGKTTTLSILSGDLAPTSGDVFINGYSILSERSAARKQMGYCPQFNPLLDLMTAREHLHMYASLKGVPADKVEDVVNDLVQAMGLKENADQITQSYSGGNKRKLALAIAMVHLLCVPLLLSF